MTLSRFRGRGVGRRFTLADRWSPIQGATHEFDVALEDADSTVLHQLTGEWSGWPTVPESLTLVAKLDAAK